jgi:hypothetical protein
MRDDGRMSDTAHSDRRWHPNDRLRLARRRTESPTQPGRCLSRQELGDLVSTYVYHHFGAELASDSKWVGKLAFGLYSEARVVSNAATASATLGRTIDPRRHIDRALAVVDSSESTWSKALVRLDAATAELKTTTPDLDQAVHHVRRALGFAGSSPLESIRQRTDTCVGLLRHWQDADVVGHFLDELDDEARELDGARSGADGDDMALPPAGAAADL